MTRPAHRIGSIAPMKTLLAILALSLACWGQTFSEGSVVGFQPLANHNGTFTYDFELCCGIPGGSGFLGNGFDIEDGTLRLFYKRPGAVSGYTVTGTISDWYAPQRISDFCTIQSATLENVWIQYQAKYIESEQAAEYSQMMCQQDGTYWSGPGGLVVHPK
jgi:hypothetical protein